MTDTFRKPDALLAAWLGIATGDLPHDQTILGNGKEQSLEVWALGIADGRYSPYGQSMAWETQDPEKLALGIHAIIRQRVRALGEPSGLVYSWCYREFNLSDALMRDLFMERCSLPQQETVMVRLYGPDASIEAITAPEPLTFETYA